MGDDVDGIVAIVLVALEAAIGARQPPSQLFDEDSVPIVRERSIEVFG